MGKEKGGFFGAAGGGIFLKKAGGGDFNFGSVENLGTTVSNTGMLDAHIDAINNNPVVNKKAIAAAGFKIVVDVVNSTGGMAVPALLQKLGVEDMVIINEEINGKFAHNPEPLPENLSGLSQEVVKQQASLGIAVDPDVDRLCFVCEDGSMFGEEYTLVAVADYILSRKKGNSVSNMSSTRALRDVTEKHGGKYIPSAVGEVNVVEKMKSEEAIIGGEGNGGVIIPELHYGRDALAGIAVF